MRPLRSVRAGLLLLLLATSGPARAALEIEIDAPDRVTWNGAAVPLGVAAGAIRWTGLDLRSDWADAEGARVRVLEGRAMRLFVALPPGGYQISCLIPGGAQGSGPFDLLLNGMPLLTQVQVPAGRDSLLSFDATLSGPNTELFWKPAVGRAVALRRIAFAPRFETADLRLGDLPAVQRTRVEVAAEQLPDPRERLRAACEFLLSHQLSTGLFDYESSAWWEAGLAARCLLAGHALLGDPRYLAATRPLFDLLLARQGEDGGWCAYAYDARTGAGSDPAEPDTVPCNTRNVADLGVTTTALALAARVEEPSRRARYLAAHRAFIDRFVTRYRRPDGSFRNGLFGGTEADSAYSVATATTAMSAIALHAVSRDPAHLALAEAAASFLADEWQESGMPRFHYHTGTPPQESESDDYHNVYYLLEGLLWVRAATVDEDLTQRIDRACHAFIHGPKGVLAHCPDGLLPLPRREFRDLTKLAGMVGILDQIARTLPDDPALAAFVERNCRELLVPELAARRRVLVFPYDHEGHKAITATAFAGLSFAQMAAPGTPFR
ncbi:MAG: hypothetical protein IPK72_14635 [Candidatus Eisenbacteria bacterium]|nr:hypothetical protein [Candidatus Eisenbacteria bacterium]